MNGHTIDAAAERSKQHGGSRHDEQRDDAGPNRLRDELGRVAVEQTSYRSGHTVQTVAGLAVGQQADGKQAPRAAYTMDGHGAGGIVQAPALEKENRLDDEGAADDADYRGRPARDKRAAC